MSEYPLEILPQDNFIPKMNIDGLHTHDNPFFVCRISYTPIEGHIDEDCDGSLIL